MLWFKGKCLHSRVEMKQLLFHSLVFTLLKGLISGFVLKHKVRDRIGRACSSLSLCLPGLAWKKYAQTCALLMLSLSRQGLFMGSMVWLYQMGFTDVIPYRFRLPITFAVDTEFVTDPSPRAWRTAGFEKGIGEGKLGRLPSHANDSRYFLFTWLEGQHFLG